MRLFAKIGLSLALCVLGIAPGRAQESTWRLVNSQSRPADPPSANPPSLAPMLGEPEPIILGAPEPIPPQQQKRESRRPSHTPTPDSNSSPSSDIFPFSKELGLTPQGWVVRGQAPPPPPSPFDGAIAGPPPGPPFVPPANPLDCGVPGDRKGNFWERLCQDMKDCGKNIFGSTGNIFQSSPEHKPFQSDHAFDMFSSPVSNPFFFLDPRSLTEVKPLFIYQQTRGSNPIFAGGSNYFAGLQGSLALTEWISIRISEFGVVFTEPHNPSNNPLFGPNAGISELHVGPQFTLIRNKDTRTLLAAGLTFEIPWGSEKTFQHTGRLGVVPYISFGQNFWRSETFGSFNFLNTTGWAGGAERSDFFFSSFHLDYNIKNQDRFFPMMELNWAHYTNSGNQTPINFEGWDLFNFGAHGVAGTDALTLNFGGRVKINSFWSAGAALGFSLLGGGNQLDNFRLTLDMIFRY